MLRKLLKHEFRATGRIMLPLYLVLLAAAVGGNFSIRVLLETDLWVTNLFGGLVLTFFAVAMIGVLVMTIAVVVRRFYKNLLQDEGYVMMTLPCSVHQHIWCKLIVSAVWIAATLTVMALSVLVMTTGIEWFTYIAHVFRELFHHITAYYALNGTAILLELLVLCFLICCAMCLRIYLALSIGHSFSTHKLAWSVGWYFIFQFALQFLLTFFMYIMEITGFWDWLGNVHILRTMQNISSPMAIIHIALLAVILGEVIYSAILYCVTAYFLKNKLNLE